jgi:hypothetical protein
VSKLTLVPHNALVFRVVTAAGDHVGNLKLINAVWKFKAIGYDDNGDVIPGGGPFTDQHNALFAEPDATTVSAGLTRPPTPPFAGQGEQ